MKSDKYQMKDGNNLIGKIHIYIKNKLENKELNNEHISHL